MKTIGELVKLSQDAYSVDNYSKAGWKDTIVFLRKQGINDDNILWFLLSKHTRWACDRSDRCYGENNSDTAREYLDRNQGLLAKLIDTPIKQLLLR